MHERFRADVDGENSQVYPALARARADLFGLCVCGTGGSTFAAGDAQSEFTIMSISKPFVFALVCQALGAEQARALLGVNSTGRPFNSIEAMRSSSDGRTNPMVNSGAIAATSLIGGESSGEKWQAIHQGLSHFAGRELSINDEVYRSAAATNHQNRAIADLLATPRSPGQSRGSDRPDLRANAAQRQRHRPGGDGVPRWPMVA